MRQSNVLLAEQEGTLALALSFLMQEGRAWSKPRQALGILSGLSIGAADTHERGDLLNSRGSWRLRLKAQSLIGGMPIAAAVRAAAITPCEGEGAEHRINTPQALLGFEPQWFLTETAHERLASG